MAVRWLVVFDCWDLVCFSDAIKNPQAFRKPGGMGDGPCSVGWSCLHLQDVGCLGGQVLLEFSDELVEGFLNAVLLIAALVFRDVALLLPLPDCVVVWKV